MNARKQCPTCHGTGRDLSVWFWWDFRPPKCNDCHGTGKVSPRVYDVLSGLREKAKEYERMAKEVSR